MFIKNQRETPELDKAIEEAVRYLDPDQKNYLEIIEGIERLNKLKEQSNRMPSPDTIAMIGGNLLGILLILKYEQLNVMTSKALSFVLKLK